MIRLAKRVFSDLFTGPDGQTFAIGRVSGVVTLLSGLALPFWAVAKGQTANFAELGVYIGGLAGGVTALITVTNKTEPPADGA